MKQPPKCSAQIARLFILPGEVFTLRHKGNTTILEDRHGSIRAEGVYHSREQLADAMFHTEYPANWQQFDRK